MSTSRSSDALITALRAVRMYETEWNGVSGMEEGVERSRREGEEERRGKEGQERRYRTKNDSIKQVNEK